jgi:type VI secretion system protein ImpM
MFTEPLTTALGYYGKVPTHGDFVSRGLPRSFIDPWDLWLQEAIMTSREHLGSQWLDYYLTSPLYRFALSPGICGDTGWFGILMPSVDKVGRYYSMTIGQQINSSANPFDILQQSKNFTELERLALSCLKDDYDLHAFNREIDQLGLARANNPIPNLTMSEQIANLTFPATWQQSLSSPETLSELLPSLLDNVLKDRCFTYSLWWTKGSDQVSPSLLFSEGLPPFNQVAAMYDGNWQQWGWASKQYPYPMPKQPTSE